MIINPTEYDPVYVHSKFLTVIFDVCFLKGLVQNNCCTNALDRLVLTWNIILMCHLIVEFGKRSEWSELCLKLFQKNN